MIPTPPAKDVEPEARRPASEGVPALATVSLHIDGRIVHAHQGATLLEAARAAGIDIPTLCHHEALEPYGGCRLCVVDIRREGEAGDPRMVASCLYPVEDGLIIQTGTERVRAVRREILELLLARCPDTPLIQELAQAYGATGTSYSRNPEPTSCILCGLCTRVCETLGPAAISLVGRGIGREVAPPFRQPPPDCIGCLACAEICPTGHIPFSRGGVGHTIWGRTFPRIACPKCGRTHLTAAAVDFWARRIGVPRADLETCDACKRAATVATILRMTGRD